jgi:hypothetical protein
MEVPQLPIRHVLANGQSIIVRSLRNDEIRSYYEALKAAAASGAGYGVDELPDIGYFVRWYVTDCYNLVYEMCASSPEQLQDSDSSVDQAKDASSKDGDGTGVTRIIAYAGFSSSLYSRSLEHPILADSNIVLLPEFRNRHWSDDLLYILQSIVYAAGFRRIFGDTAMRNIPMLLFTSKMKGAATGSIPRGIFLKEFGWTDLMVGGYELRASLVEGQRKHRGHQALVSKI